MTSAGAAHRPSTRPDSADLLATLPVSLADIRTAAGRIASFVVRTPVLCSEPLSSDLGLKLWFKCENLQHVGAFKARGACNAVLSLTDMEASAGVVTHSSGNHAAALARAASIRGIRAQIVMPHNSAAVKLAAVRRFGIEPILCEPTAAAREATAARVMAETGATMIHPYNDTRVIAGQGTVALELVEQLPRLDAVIVPVGGGGLLAGTLIALRSTAPHIRVYAAEPAWADDAARSLQTGRIEQPLRYDTVADGLRTPLGTLTFPIVHALVDEVLLADEESIVTASHTIQRELRVIAEPSGAVPLAALQSHVERFRGQTVAVVISGGNRDQT